MTSSQSQPSQPTPPAVKQAQERSWAMAVVKQLRPKQWAKNLIVFAPLLFSGKFSDVHSIFAATFCAMGFSAISSGIYVVNDLVDVKADREHPTKRFRPIASGQISQSQAIVLATLCMLAGFALAFVLRPTLVLIFLAYLVLNFGYSFSWKSYAIIDVLCIAAGFVLRAVAGAVAVHVQASEWFLLCTTLGAVFLGLEKRRHELVLLANQSGNHRVSLKQYTLPLLQRMEGLITPSLITSYAFYTFLSSQGHWMMLTVPVVLYGIMRYQFLSEDGKSTGTPEDVFWHDRPTQVTLVLWVAICALVIYGNPNAWLRELSHLVDSLQLHM